MPDEALNHTMTVEDFCELHEIEQEELVFNEGVFLGNFVEAEAISDVYQLFNFYVSFSYILATHERAIIKAFTNPSQLPMLDDIDISGLI